jgi:uncharacterized membrane protein YgcG
MDSAKLKQKETAMMSMFKTFAVLGVIAGSALVAQPARADHVSIGFGVNVAPTYRTYAPPVYYQPAYVPAVTTYYAAPVYSYPSNYYAPAYYAPPVAYTPAVVCDPPVYYPAPTYYVAPVYSSPVYYSRPSFDFSFGLGFFGGGHGGGFGGGHGGGFSGGRGGGRR